MPFLEVDINTNPIPANVLVPRPFTFPSGGNSLGGGVVIAPHNPIAFGANGGSTVPVHSVYTKLGTANITLLGNRVMTGSAICQLNGFLSSNVIKLLDIETVLTFDGALPGVGDLGNCRLLIDALVGSQPRNALLIMFTKVTNALTGAHTVDLWMKNLCTKISGLGVVSNADLDAVSWQLSCMEFDAV